MKKIEKTEAGVQYALAYEAHYTMKNLGDALRLYRHVMDEYPEALEVEYARTQIQNIVNNLVPKQELTDAHIELIVKHLEIPASTITEHGAVNSASVTLDSWQG